MARATFRNGIRALVLAGGGLASAAFAAACFQAGDGVTPPTKTFYFPVGLAVSAGGNALYVVNSDFDLQYNGGTLQSYDLRRIRLDVLKAIQNPADPTLPLVHPPNTNGRCPDLLPDRPTGEVGKRQALGEICAPPVDSTFYVRDSAIIGAFATNLLLSRNGTRLFSPIRGDTSLTWADVAYDDPEVAAPESGSYAPFDIQCGARTDNRCAADHQAGSDPDEFGNTRRITMPGEPFGLAESEDGSSLVVSHQTETRASLFDTGFRTGQATTTPSLQFVVEGLPGGGNGIVAIPHDPQAFPPCVPRPDGSPCIAQPPRPAFLLTSRAAAQLTLLRYYADESDGTVSSLRRPFLQREAVFGITGNSTGTDSRGVVIDPSPRLRCKARVKPVDANAKPPRTQADVDADLVNCARRPARIFIANRSPASLLVGEVGQDGLSPDGSFDPDRVVLSSNVPLTAGPSNVYLAPVVDAEGNYALRVFVVCFDSAAIFVYDPDARRLENLVRVGQGPYALAFDPFSFEDVALGKPAPADPRSPTPELRRFRFGYVASFTKSFVQVLDLDNSRTDKSTYERVVFTLGVPTPPKGS
ncbi:MAG: hypothetical protein U0169_26105 [Polyangiaceae bacterium]